MNLLGNIIWLVFGGFLIAVEYIVTGLVLCVTIIGIPFGIQCFKLAALTLFPFDKEARVNPREDGCISVLFNFLWFIFGGFVIVLTHLFFGVLFSITIIGIPFGKQHFKLMRLAISPFNKEVVDI